MFRKAGGLVFVLLSLSAFCGCSDAPRVPVLPGSRLVLVEFFTWQRCVYCPYAARALDSLVREFQDSVVIIGYHRRVAGDTLSPEYVEERRGFYYESGGEPATVFDGGPVVRTPGPEYNYETFRNYILGAKSVPPRVGLQVSAALRDSQNGEIAVEVWGVDSTPGESLRLFLVITEDSVRTELPGATDSVFNHVMRMMLPDVRGRGCLVVPGETLRFVHTLRIPDFWDARQISAVAFVQQPSSRRVLQTSRKRFEYRR